MFYSLPPVKALLERGSHTREVPAANALGIKRQYAFGYILLNQNCASPVPICYKKGYIMHAYCCTMTDLHPLAGTERESGWTIKDETDALTAKERQLEEFTKRVSQEIGPERTIELAVGT